MFELFPPLRRQLAMSGCARLAGHRKIVHHPPPPPKKKPWESLDLEREVQESMLLIMHDRET